MMAEPGAPMAHATLMMAVSASRVPVTIATPGPARRDPAGLGGPGRRLRRQRGPGRPGEILAAVVDRLGVALRGVAS